jgi:ribosomal protein S18 acetylase RimI-like enzyme
VTREYRIEILGEQHARNTFSCGVEALDSYFLRQVTQDIRRRVTACYVALETASGLVAGYYTLTAVGVPLADMPENTIKKLPRYPSVPVARLGRLAVDIRHQGQKLGAALLWDAIVRSFQSEVAVFALVVDTKDRQAETFYQHHGFHAFGRSPRQLMLPLTNLKDRQ